MKPGLSRLLRGQCLQACPPLVLTDDQKVGAIPECGCVVQGIAVGHHQVWQDTARALPRQGRPPTIPKGPSLFSTQDHGLCHGTSRAPEQNWLV